MCGQAQDLPLQSFSQMELPKYLFKLHETAPTGSGVEIRQKNGKLNSPTDKGDLGGSFRQKTES